MEEAERIARNEHKSTKEHKFELIFCIEWFLLILNILTELVGLQSFT